MRPPSSQEQEINLLELVKKVWDSRKLILRMCGIGAIVGLVIGFSKYPYCPGKQKGLSG